MKRLYFTIAVACLLISCGGAQNTNNQLNDSKIDSIANQTVEQNNPEKNPEPFIMVDGKVFDLKGNVKKSVTYGFYSDENGNPQGTRPESEQTIEFGADGKQTKHSDFYPDGKCVRNSNDQIEKLSWFCSDFGFDFETSYKYNQDGFPINIKEINLSEQESTLEYNTKNELILQTVIASYEEGQEGKITKSFKNLEYDENGNWTKRLIEINEGIRDMGQTEYEWQKSFWVELRKIEY
ncbi:MAG: hypothetical protein MJ211_08235 [Bacteroidales bacterium]|nr:hypothetical protein [Bacteroidales bacterium]